MLSSFYYCYRYLIRALSYICYNLQCIARYRISLSCSPCGNFLGFHIILIASQCFSFSFSLISKFIIILLSIRCIKLLLIIWSGKYDIFTSNLFSIWFAFFSCGTMCFFIRSFLSLILHLDLFFVSYFSYSFLLERCYQLYFFDYWNELKGFQWHLNLEITDIRLYSTIILYTNYMEE